MGHVHKIAISMSPEVLRRLDEAVARTDHSRSRFVQHAVAAYLDAAEATAIQARLNAAFDGEAADEQRRESEAFLGSVSQEEAW